MSLLENIAEGFGRAANAPGVVSDIEKRKAERTDLSHMELQTKADQILGDVKQLQARRASLDPKSPTYQQDVAGIDKSLGDHQQAFTDIFHPVKNPTAFQNLGRYLQKHITGKAPAPLPASNEVTPGRMKELAAGAAPPGQNVAQPTPPPATDVNPYATKVKNLEAIGVPHDEAVRIATNQKPPAAKTADGEPKPVKQTSDERARADFAEFKKEHPHYQGTFERWRKEQGTLPKAAGPAKPQRLSATQNKAQSAYVEAVKLDRLADLVAKNPNDATNVKGFAIALERARAGRFTSQALDRMLEAGWGNRLQQWANNPTTGTLPADVLRQLVEGAKQNRTAAKDAMDEAMTLTATVPNTPAEAKARVQGPAKKHRIKVGNLTYEYKGSGNTADMANYTQVQ